MNHRNIQKPLTSTKEDYLRAIFILLGRNSKVGTTDIAKYLNLSKSTVSERLKELMAQKLIEPSFYSSIRLTSRGNKIGEQLTYKHRLIEVFLNQKLKIPKNQVHAEAHKLEHAFSDKVIKKLSKFLGNPKTDPHGKVIPRI
ncbi:MAG TPA: metal-dependent transcriptional regulator [Candidatus Limnocylindria bacterium]|nr:metal-dependent transcriptional regulator [Candidatus Limnocylindria bacterium]